MVRSQFRKTCTKNDKWKVRFDLWNTIYHRGSQVPKDARNAKTIHCLLVSIFITKRLQIDPTTQKIGIHIEQIILSRSLGRTFWKRVNFSLIFEDRPGSKPEPKVAKQWKTLTPTVFSALQNSIVHHFGRLGASDCEKDSHSSSKNWPQSRPKWQEPLKTNHPWAHV